MGLFEQIKNEAKAKGLTIANADELKLQQILNRTFYVPKKINEETTFVKHVMTRGFETQERIGLHASAITKGSDEYFCVRQQVLSLLFKQNQNEHNPIELQRKFEEGNAIHEKWQRLLIRSGYCDWYQCDMTCYNEEYMQSYTPDIIAFIPSFYDEDEIVIEVKSMFSWAYKSSSTHSDGQKQLAWYMHLLGKKKGFVLAENKDTQEFRIEMVEYDKSLVEPFINRSNNVKKHYYDYLDGAKLSFGKLDKTTKRCKNCNMYDACTNNGMGRIPINEEIKELLIKRNEKGK